MVGDGDAQLFERAMCTLILFCTWIGACFLLVEALLPLLEFGGLRLEHLDSGGGL